WLAPYYNEQPYFDKPILFYWFQAAGMAVAGENETGARLGSAIVAIALVAVTIWLGTVLFSFEAGFTGGLLLAASPPVFALARYAILDMIFTAFLFGGVSLIAVAALKNRPGLQWPGYVLISLSVVTKGPLSFVMCGLAIGKLWDDVRAYRAKTLDSGSILLWCWTIAIVAFFTASRFKLDHYVFPAAPALCLICARGWADVRARAATAANAGTRLGAQTIGPILVLAGTGGGYFMIARL